MLSKFKKICSSMPFGFLGMVLIIFVVEHSVDGQVLFKNEIAESWAIKSQRISNEKTVGGIYCFGDSLMQYGVYPRLLNHHNSVYNYSLPGGCPESSYYMLTQVLKNNYNIKSILVNYMPYQIYDIERFKKIRERLWPEIFPNCSIVDFTLFYNDVNYFSHIFISNFITTLKSRFEIRDAILASLQSETREDDVYRVALTRRNLESNLGAIALPDGLRAKPVGHPQEMNDYKGFPDKTKFYYLIKFIELAQKHNIQIFWIIPPVSQEAQVCIENMGVDKKYSEFVNNICTKYDNVIVIDFRQANYEWNLFHDSIHLNCKGGTMVSISIAEILSKKIFDYRWYVVNHKEQSGQSELVENVFQSHAALGLVAPKPRRR